MITIHSQMYTPPRDPVPSPVLVIRTERERQSITTTDWLTYVDYDRVQDAQDYVRRQFESAMPAHLAYWNSQLWC